MRRECRYFSETSRLRSADRVWLIDRPSQSPRRRRSHWPSPWRCLRTEVFLLRQPVALEDADALPEPLAMAVLVALASPPAPPTSIDCPELPPVAEAEAEAPLVPELAVAKAVAGPAQIPAIAIIPPSAAASPPLPPVEIALAPATPDMMVVAAVALATPPVPPPPRYPIMPMPSESASAIRRQARRSPWLY